MTTFIELLCLCTTAIVCHSVSAQEKEIENITAWRYQVIADRYSTEQDGEMVEVPAAAFAEILVSEDLSKIVYRKFSGKSLREDRIYESQMTFGYDGKNYWAASFRTEHFELSNFAKQERNRNIFAEHVHVEREKPILTPVYLDHPHDKSLIHLHWYKELLLPELLYQVGAKKWNHKSIINAFENSPTAKKIFADGKFHVEVDATNDWRSRGHLIVPREFIDYESNHQYFESIAYEYGPDGERGKERGANAGLFNYFVEVSENPPYILKCRRDCNVPMWIGGIPPPKSWTVVLDKNQVEVPAAVFTYQYYSNTDTNIEERVAVKKEPAKANAPDLGKAAIRAHLIFTALRFWWH